MRRLLPVLFLIPLGASGQTSSGLERINFFPDADAFGALSYSYRHHEIETPQATVNTKEVNSYVNGFELTYGHRFARRFIGGAHVSYESATENGVVYGVPFREHFESHGFTAPEVFGIYRLRPQKEERGLVDINISYSPAVEKRIVGDGEANRLNGRQILKAALSHGLREEEWEFRSQLLYEYVGHGIERNGFTDTTSDLNNYNNYTFNFTGQYGLHELWHGFAAIGITYRGMQTIVSRNGERREIQAGTGRILEGGLKRSVGKWTLLELRYYNRGNDYFVKGLEENLEGEEHLGEWRLTLLQAF